MVCRACASHTHDGTPQEGKWQTTTEPAHHDEVRPPRPITNLGGEVLQKTHCLLARTTLSWENQWTETAAINIHYPFHILVALEALVLSEQLSRRTWQVWGCIRAEHPYVEERILMTCPKPPGPYVSTSAISSVHRTGGELLPRDRSQGRFNRHIPTYLCELGS